MAKDKKSFVAYADWNTTFEKLSDDEAGKLAKMMFAFVSDLNPEAPDRMTELLFDPIKNQLKRDLKSYEQTIDKKSRQGRLGNLKRWSPDLYTQVTFEKITLEEAEDIAKHRTSENNIAPAINSSLNIADTVNDNVNVIDTDNDILLEKETKEILSDFEKDIDDHLKITTSVNPETEKEKKVAQKKEKEQPPDLESFVQLAREIYQNDLQLDFSRYEFAVRSKFTTWKDAGWKDGNNKPILAWKNKLRNTIPHLKPIYGNINKQQQAVTTQKAVRR